MGKRKFYLRRLARTFVRPFLYADLLAGFLAIVGGAIVYWWPKWGGTMNLLLWAIPVVVLVGSVIAGFLLAPFYIYREERKRADRLEEKAQPVLEIVDVKPAGYQQMGRTHVLVIKNKGTDKAEDCTGQLIEIEIANPKGEQSMFIWPVNCDLTWTEQEGDWGIDKPFTIPGKDSKALQVIIWRYVDGKPVVEIAYKANQDLRVDNRITHIEDVYMVISVTSLNRLPIYAVCRYRKIGDTSLEQKLELRDVTKDKPTINSYLTSDSHKEGCQT